LVTADQRDRQNRGSGAHWTLLAHVAGAIVGGFAAGF
jgi:hypothetical protein